MYELFVGKTNRNNVQAVYSGGKLASFSTVVIGCGLFSDLIYHTERQRWLKKARYVGEIYCDELCLKLLVCYVVQYNLFSTNMDIAKSQIYQSFMKSSAKILIRTCKIL